MVCPEVCGQSCLLIVLLQEERAVELSCQRRRVIAISLQRQTEIANGFVEIGCIDWIGATKVGSCEYHPALVIGNDSVKRDYAWSKFAQSLHHRLRLLSYLFLLG